MIDRQAFARPVKPIYGLEIVLRVTDGYLVESFISLRWDRNAYEKVVLYEGFWHFIQESLKGRDYLNTIMSNKDLYHAELRERDKQYRHLISQTNLTNQYIAELLQLENVSLLTLSEIKNKRQYFFPED